MKVQKVKQSNGSITWIVIGDDYLPIQPIAEFLSYLNNTGKTPCTVRSYANHLNVYWRYLITNQIDWTIVTLQELANFVGQLRTNTKTSNIIHLTESSARKTSTINTILACIASFYHYYHLLGKTTVTLSEDSPYSGRSNRYKAFLHHIYKHKPIQKRIITLKKFKDIPKTINQQQYEQLLAACNNMRDKFLINLLYETGLRIGQALALWHEDIISWDNEIHIQRKLVSLNDAYNKTHHPYTVHVSPQLISRYNDYVDSLKNTVHDQYVFINLLNYTPLRYSAIHKLFLRLSHKIGIKVTPHMLRHTHATQLIQSGWDAAFVQKRLGHTCVQTTLDVYSHLDQQDLKKAYKKYLSDKENLK